MPPDASGFPLKHATVPSHPGSLPWRHSAPGNRPCPSTSRVFSCSCANSLRSASPSVDLRFGLLAKPETSSTDRGTLGHDQLRGPLDLLLVLHIQLRHADRLRRVDFVLRQELR